MIKMLTQNQPKLKEQKLLIYSNDRGGSQTTLGFLDMTMFESSSSRFLTACASLKK
jgi:hypothetical protein